MESLPASPNPSAGSLATELSPVCSQADADSGIPSANTTTHDSDQSATCTDMHASPDPEDETCLSFDTTSLSMQLSDTRLSKPTALSALPAVLASAGAKVTQADGIWTVRLPVPKEAAGRYEGEGSWIRLSV